MSGCWGSGAGGPPREADIQTDLREGRRKPCGGERGATVKGPGRSEPASERRVEGWRGGWGPPEAGSRWPWSFTVSFYLMHQKGN